MLLDSIAQFSFRQKEYGGGTLRPPHNANQSSAGGSKHKVYFQSAVLSFSKMLVWMHPLFQFFERAGYRCSVKLGHVGVDSPGEAANPFIML